MAYFLQHQRNHPVSDHRRFPQIPSEFSLQNNTLTPAGASSATIPKIPKMGNVFTTSQWKEYEHQCLILHHFKIGASVPHMLIQPILESLNKPIHHLMRSGEWDTEPGRCRRTDGKKWRCSKEVIEGEKYCPRHMHRGRNRSKKNAKMSRKDTFDIDLNINTALQLFHP